jgi:hypothetical protein
VGDGLGVVIAGVGSIVATVCGFVLAFRRDTATREEQLTVKERAELELRRRWYRVVMAEVIIPVRDWFAQRGQAEPVDFDRLTKYPPEDDS